MAGPPSHDDHSTIPTNDKKRKSSGGGDGSRHNSTITLTYVEFYSGIGGWSLALQTAVKQLALVLQKQKELRGFKDTAAAAAATEEEEDDNEDIAPTYKLQRLAALDHSDLCTKVFEFNFGPSFPIPTTNATAIPTQSKSPCRSFAIERLTIQQAEAWRADIWCMSPPCQPHTRQHDNQELDMDDPRSKSFLHLCHLLRSMTVDALPRLILLENVVGFETSRSFQKWQEGLAQRDYSVGHFHLTPPQVGLPNDRPRYYCLAVRTNVSGSGMRSDASSIVADAPTSLHKYVQRDDVPSSKQPPSPPPILHTSIPELDVTPEDSKETKEKLLSLSNFLDDHYLNDIQRPHLHVPDKVLQSTSSWCFDIVCPYDRRTSCFTHSYGRYNRGTGSVLYEVDSNDNTTKGGGGGILVGLKPPQERQYDADWAKHLDGSKLRYFSGTELARLFGFNVSNGGDDNKNSPEKFSFPQDVTLKQQWKLFGNSLNVGVASRLAELGILLMTDAKFQN